MFGTSLLRLLMRLRLGQPISDGTSGLYAVNRNALALLADPYVCEAPEVEALVRITDAKLRLIEVPVHMRQREHGESSFRGKRAVELVVTIGLTLFAGELLRRRRQQQKRAEICRGAADRHRGEHERGRADELPAAAELTRGRERPQQRRRRGVDRPRRAAGATRARRTPPTRAAGRRPRADRAAAPSAVRRLWLRGRVRERGGVADAHRARRDRVVDVDRERRRRPRSRARGAGRGHERRDDGRRDQRVLQRVAVGLEPPGHRDPYLSTS